MKKKVPKRYYSIPKEFFTNQSIKCYERCTKIRHYRTQGKISGFKPKFQQKKDKPQKHNIHSVYPQNNTKKVQKTKRDGREQGTDFRIPEKRAQIQLKNTTSPKKKKKLTKFLNRKKIKSVKPISIFLAFK